MRVILLFWLEAIQRILVARIVGFLPATSSGKSCLSLILPIVPVLILMSLLRAEAQELLWSETNQTKKGVVTLYWYESRPFIYKNAAGQIDGLEKELMDDFRLFLLERYNIHLQLKWIEDKSFDQIIPSVAKSPDGTFGCSAISITPERKELVDFTPPYMADISVLITSKNVPVFENDVAFDEVARHLTAVTIQGTTYESDLIAIQQERNIVFPIQYIPSLENILQAIREMNNAFGFIDLPIYLMELKQNAGSVNRQNLFTRKREGYSFIIPKESSWKAPLEEYFTSERFKNTMNSVSVKYFDKNLYEFLESLTKNGNDDLVLLNKEKEIQLANILFKEQQLQQQGVIRNFLIATIILSILVLALLFLHYQRTSRANELLNTQKSKIETQGNSIEIQNKQLELKANRLQHLNDEKNNLIKILAHDLRSPINQVQGLAQVLLLQNKTLPTDQQDLIHKIIDSSIRLNTMIGKILDVDAIESNRVNLILEDIQVMQIVRRVIASFEKQALAKNLQVQLESDDDAITIQADLLFFTEILENLLSNAIKFSPSNKSILISVKKAENDVTISVKDEGPGLTSSDFEKLFEKYQRLSARPTNGETSTGLGLSIVKKYVDLMNGTVWAESQPGKGATFYLRFIVPQSAA